MLIKTKQKIDGTPVYFSYVTFFPTYRGTHQLEIAVGVFFDIMINS